MRALSAAELLEVWERGVPLPPARQALLLLAAACPEEPVEILLTLPVGRRDGRLLALREWTFGDQISGAVSCPSCDLLLELEMPVAALQAESSLAPAETLAVEVDDWAVRFRLPTSEDLLAVMAMTAPTPADLLGRCLVDAQHGEESVPADRLPEALVLSITEAMESADPQAHVTLALSCAGCQHEWASPFDIVSFFWGEIDRWARATLHDVHALAATYGWSEAEILAMSAWRRAAYLGFVRG